MLTTHHTHDPWVIDVDGGYGADASEAPGHGIRIWAGTNPVGPPLKVKVAEAWEIENARLIAQAPTLLAQRDALVKAL